MTHQRKFKIGRMSDIWWIKSHMILMGAEKIQDWEIRKNPL